MLKFDGHVTAKQGVSAPFEVYAESMEEAERIVEGMVEDGYPFQWSDDDEAPEFDMVAEIGDDGEEYPDEPGADGREPSPKRGALVTVQSQSGTPGMDEFPTARLPKNALLAHSVILDHLHRARTLISRELGRYIEFGNLTVKLGEPFDAWEEFRKPEAAEGQPTTEQQ